MSLPVRSANLPPHNPLTCLHFITTPPLSGEFPVSLTPVKNSYFLTGDHASPSGASVNGRLKETGGEKTTQAAARPFLLEGME
jgi:hypothetical protein